MLPALRVSAACSCACASTRYCTVNSTSTMPPGSCLRSNSARPVRMAGLHLSPHLDHVGASFARSRGSAQDRLALGLERGADRGVAGDEARARERLVLPRPRLLALVAAERMRATTPAGPRRRRAAGAGRCRRASPPRWSLVSQRVEPLREARVASRRRFVGVVVQEHDVEIRRVAQLLAAELAVADDREPRRRGVGALASASRRRRASPRARCRRARTGDRPGARRSAARPGPARAGGTSARAGSGAARPSGARRRPRARRSRRASSRAPRAPVGLGAAARARRAARRAGSGAASGTRRPTAMRPSAARAAAAPAGARRAARDRRCGG